MLPKKLRSLVSRRSHCTRACPPNDLNRPVKEELTRKFPIEVTPCYSHNCRCSVAGKAQSAIPRITAILRLASSMGEDTDTS